MDLDTNLLGQCSETDYARLILVHEPGVTIFMGTLHPDGSLYENPVDLKKAQKEHRQFVEALESHRDIKVLKVVEILKSGCDEDMKERLKLEDFAKECLTYQLDENDNQEMSPEEMYLLSDTYKEKCLQAMNTDQLVDIILTNPTIKLKKSDFNTKLSTTTLSFSPLSNLVFCRDQQITTRKGIIMGQLHSTTRAPEVKVMKFCFQKLGFKIVGEVPLPGQLEGGDFFPINADLCMIGVGLRTNMFAVRYCMDRDLFGTTRVAVVKDCFDWNQQRMHLDTFFNIVNSKCVVLLDTIMGEESPKKRLVDEFEKDSSGKYVLKRHDVEFSSYLRGLGYHIIPLSKENQANYGLNFLNLGDRLICVDKESARKIARDPMVEEIVDCVEYKNITTMYGASHCSTQVLYRKPRQDVEGKDHLQKKQRRDCEMTTGLYLFPNPTVDKDKQVTDSVLMIPPTCFFFNYESAQDNTFMVFQPVTHASKTKTSRTKVQGQALKQFMKLFDLLVSKGINAHVTLNDRRDNPDSVFINWFSTHHKNETPKNKPIMVLYPLRHTNQRGERDQDIILRLSQHYEVIDLTHFEKKDQYLEADSSLVLDRLNHIAYMCNSGRSDISLAREWCQKLGYSLVDFIATTSNGKAIYHTSLMLCVLSKVVVVCSEVVIEKNQRQNLLKKLSKDRVIIEITTEQLNKFCASLLELRNSKGENILVMSDTAFNGFTKEQHNILAKYYPTILHADISTLETYGGCGIRGMAAQLF